MTRLLPVLIVAVLVLNVVLWKRRGRGWRQQVDAFVAVVQPYVPEQVVAVVVLQPGGTVGRQARAEQGRGLNTLVGGMSGDVAGALAEHRAEERADRERLPPMWALAVTDGGQFLLPVELRHGQWAAGPPERSWRRGEARYETEPRALTVQVTISAGGWTGRYEAARDPAGYVTGVLARLAGG